MISLLDFWLLQNSASEQDLGWGRGMAGFNDGFRAWEVCRARIKGWETRRNRKSARPLAGYVVPEVKGN